MSSQSISINITPAFIRAYLASCILLPIVIFLGGLIIGINIDRIGPKSSSTNIEEINSTQAAPVLPLPFMVETEADEGLVPFLHASAFTPFVHFAENDVPMVAPSARQSWQAPPYFNARFLTNREAPFAAHRFPGTLPARFESFADSHLANVHSSDSFAENASLDVHSPMAPEDVHAFFDARFAVEREAPFVANQPARFAHHLSPFAFGDGGVDAHRFSHV